MTAPRRPDWRARLARHLADAARQPFEWGRNDCALFAAGCIAAMTGEDPAAPWRGRYATEDEGLALIRAAGFDDHLAWVAAHLVEVPPALAQVGDLAVINVGNEAALGVIAGATVAVMTRHGMGHLTRGHAVRAFRVG